MPTDEVRYMWLMVFFDLPVKTKRERLEATRFRNFLLKDGFMMIQFSVYMRICRGQDAVEKHTSRVKGILPKTGNIRALQVTDRQYARMKTLLGERRSGEIYAGEQLILL